MYVFSSYTFGIPHAGAIYINITSGNEIHQRNNRDEEEKNEKLFLSLK